MEEKMNEAAPKIWCEAYKNGEKIKLVYTDYLLDLEESSLTQEQLKKYLRELLFLQMEPIVAHPYYFTDPWCSFRIWHVFNHFFDDDNLTRSLFKGLNDAAILERRKKHASDETWSHLKTDSVRLKKSDREWLDIHYENCEFGRPEWFDMPDHVIY